jgi:hypothetical protein
MSMRLGVPIVLSQHADEHRSKDPILLAVDQQLGEGTGLRLMGQILPEQADTQAVAKRRRGEDPVARFQEEARWSSFTNRWTRAVAPGPPRWFRRMIIGAFVLMAVVGFVVGLIGLLTHNW